MWMIMRPARHNNKKTSFDLHLPERPDLGHLSTRCQARSDQLCRPQDWKAGMPIPEGLYLMSPMQVAERTTAGEPDWSTQTPLYYDLIPTHQRMHRALRCWRLCGPGQPQSPYDICLDSVGDLLRLYEWSLMAPLDLLAVDHGLGVGWRANIANWQPLTRLGKHPLKRAAKVLGPRA